MNIQYIHSIFKCFCGKFSKVKAYVKSYLWQMAVTLCQGVGTNRSVMFIQEILTVYTALRWRSAKYL